VEQPGVEQLADHEAQTAGRLEVVDVRAAVGVDAGQQRHGGGQGVEVVPGHADAGGGRYGNQVHREVGGAARGQEGDDPVDDRPLVHQASDGSEVGG